MKINAYQFRVEILASEAENEWTIFQVIASNSTMKAARQDINWMIDRGHLEDSKVFYVGKVKEG